MLYAAVNFAGMYTKYLTDRSQRKAFLETHRSTEARYKTQKENEQQEKLLLSGRRLLVFFFLSIHIRRVRGRSVAFETNENRRNEIGEGNVTNSPAMRQTFIDDERFTTPALAIRPLARPNLTRIAFFSR